VLPLNFMTDRLAFLDLGRSFFSRASPRREHHRAEGEHNWKKGCWSPHAVLP
jgi:hypothetical protein